MDSEGHKVGEGGGTNLFSAFRWTVVAGRIFPAICVCVSMSCTIVETIDSFA